MPKPTDIQDLRDRNPARVVGEVCENHANLERLEEALDRVGRDVHSWDELKWVLDAARQWLRWGPAVEAAEEVWWCNVHDAGLRQTDSFAPSTCWAFDLSDTECAMFPRRMLPQEVWWCMKHDKPSIDMECEDNGMGQRACVVRRRLLAEEPK